MSIVLCNAASAIISPENSSENQWQTQVIDGGITGETSSIAVDSNGNPHISYQGLMGKAMF